MRTTFQSLFDLAPDGVYRYHESLHGTVVSYTTFSPLPEGGFFLLHFPLPAIAGLTPLGSILFCGARTFLSRVE